MCSRTNKEKANGTKSAIPQIMLNDAKLIWETISNIMILSNSLRVFFRTLGCISKYNYYLKTTMKMIYLI